MQNIKNGTNTNVVISYTLDNRISVYGEVSGEAEIVDKSGYLVYFDANTSIPQAYVTTDDPKNDEDIKAYKKVSSTRYNGIKIEAETLEEQVLYKENDQYILETFKYVYDIKHEKLYFDPLPDRNGDGIAEGDFFTVNSKTLEREYINDEESEQKIKIGDTDCKYKSISILWGTDGSTATEYKKVYQALNGKDRGKWCIGIKQENADNEDFVDTEIKQQKMEEMGLSAIALWEDCSAISYYTESYAFTNWVKQNLGGNIAEQKVKYELNTETKQFETTYISEPCNGLFDITVNNNPESSTSQFVEHKTTIMRDAINKNLNTVISNYSKQGIYGFKLPELTEQDWNQMFSNISLITFFQGVPIGLKNYNNYAIATSTTNREYVDPGEIYFSVNAYKQEESGDTTKTDNNYHMPYCSHSVDGIIYTGYRSVEYTLKEYTQKDITGNELDTTYYYQHDNQVDGNSETACYYCVINKANYEENATATQVKSYNEALARERYYQEKSIEGKVGVKIIYDANKQVQGEITGIYNVPEDQDADIGETTTISSQRPYITTNNKFIKFIFRGWSLKPDNVDSYGNIIVDYYPGQKILCDESKLNEDGDIKLYGVWSIALSNMDWYRDYKWTYPKEYWETPTPDGTKVADGSISNIRILEQTDTVSEESINTVIEMVGNSVYQGKGAMWTTFESEFLTISSFKFNYYINKGDSFNAAGFLFDIKDYGNYITGYMLSINFKGEFLTLANGKSGAVYKFEYRKNEQTMNFMLTGRDLVEAITIGNYNSEADSQGSGTISISVEDDGGYTIRGTELGESIHIPAYNNSPNTFGFFSDHYSHNCSRIGYFKIDNMVVMVKDK